MTKVKKYGKRYIKIYKICKKYLINIQKSVFEGELKESQIKKLEIELKQYMRKDLDSVKVFSFNSQKWMHKQYWGKQDDATSFFI